MLYVLGSPCGPYYPEGMKPIKILVDDSYVRAWPNGCGDRKVAGNYGPTIFSQAGAQEQGYSQCLFLIPHDGELYISECGAMNIFFLIKSEQTGGSPQLVTPPLDGTILPGVTRDSILSLSREWGIYDVSERQISVSVQWAKILRLLLAVLELYVSTTACKKCRSRSWPRAR